MKCLSGVFVTSMLALLLIPVDSAAQERVTRRQVPAVPAQRVEALEVQTEAISGWWDGPISLTFGKAPPGEVVGKLEVPEGSYVIIAKMEVNVRASAAGVLGCRLTAGGSSDEGRAAWESASGDFAPTAVSSTPHALALMAVSTYAEPGTIWLQCWGHPSAGLIAAHQNSLTVGDVKMTAIRVAGLTMAPRGG